MCEWECRSPSSLYARQETGRSDCFLVPTPPGYSIHDKLNSFTLLFPSSSFAIITIMLCNWTRIPLRQITCYCFFFLIELEKSPSQPTPYFTYLPILEVNRKVLENEKMALLLILSCKLCILSSSM